MALPQTPYRPRLDSILAAALILLAVFALATAEIQRDSLWFDEGYTLFVVRDDSRLPDTLPGAARFVFDSVRSAIERARADVHPPLYFILFDGWTLLAGESVYAARLPSVLLGLIGLAGTYTLGRRLFDRPTALIAAAVLGTASIFVYYTREARMYTLLLALAVLATLAYERWRSHPSLLRTLLYSALLAALPYVHYAGGLIFIGHALHLLLTRPRQSWRISLPGGVALVLFAAWIPSLWWQLNTHGGPAAPPFTNLSVGMAALIFFFTGGYWGLYLIPFALGSALTRLRQHGDALLLLALWLVLTPLGLLLISLWIPAVFQVRYALGGLPAGALLVAFGLRWVGDDLPLIRFRLPRNTVRWVRFGLLAILLYTQITVYPYVWPPKSRWDDATRLMTAARQPLEPAITSIPAHNPAAYYDRLYDIRRGISLDLAWRWQEPADMANYVAHMGSAESVWLVMPSTFASTWDAARELLNSRHVGYRDSVMDMVFYRFDSGPADDLSFHFGDQLVYDGGIRHELYAVPGDDFCFNLSLTTQVDLPPGYTIDFYLTQGFDTLRAATTLDIDAAAADDPIQLMPCIPIPANSPAGPHHLRMRIYEPQGQQSLPVLEAGTVYWSDVLMFALVHVG